ncbi:MAG: hypothetical protein OXC46_11380, partial [Thaumarchaeota archaeon]|nr:hypothetical protein [Nitrososphaerota archaeon]
MNYFDGCSRCQRQESPLFEFDGVLYCFSCLTPEQRQRYNDLRLKAHYSKESLKIYAMRSGMSE